MTYFPETSRWFLPEPAFRASLDEMAIDGRAGNEGLALWLGHKQGESALVTHVMCLRGQGVLKRPALLIVDPSAMNAVTAAAVEHGLMLIGQVHSHGEGYGVDLSPTDRESGIRVPYYLSVVVPGYALHSKTSLKDCGVHVFRPEGQWVRLSPRGIANSIELTAGSVQVLTIGTDSPGVRR